MAATDRPKPPRAERPATTRFFVALRPPARRRKALHALAVALAQRFGGRALAAADLHLTLAFVGQRPVADRERLLAAAGSARPGAGARVARLGSFDRRLIWIGPEAPDPALEACARRVRLALAAAGIEFDARPFRAHLTLLRGARSFDGDWLAQWRPDASHAERALAPDAHEPAQGERARGEHWRLALGESAPPGDGIRYRWTSLEDAGEDAPQEENEKAAEENDGGRVIKR